MFSVTSEGKIRGPYSKAPGRGSEAAGHNNCDASGHGTVTRREPDDISKSARDAGGALSQNGEGADDGDDAEDFSVERERKTTSYTADDEVRMHTSSAHKKSAGSAGGSAYRGRTTKDNADEHSVAHVDNIRRVSKRGADVTGDVNCDVG